MSHNTQPGSLRQRTFALLQKEPHLKAGDIAQRLGCKRGTAQNYHRQWRLSARSAYQGPNALAKIDPLSYPLKTSKGIAHGPAIEPPACSVKGANTCDVCSKVKKCRTYVRQGSFIRCERVLESELL